MTTEEYEIWQDDMCVAGVSGPIEEAYTEIMHYYRMYSQDGPVEIYKVTRELIPIVGGSLI